MATSIPASASSPASIIPVGPPPAITTACSVTTTPVSVGSGSASHSAARPGPCRKPPGAQYVESGGVLAIPPFRCRGLPRPGLSARWRTAPALLPPPTAATPRSLAARDAVPTQHAARHPAPAVLGGALG